MKNSIRVLFCAILFSSLTYVSHAQDGPPDSAAGMQRPGAASSSSDPQPYEKVITKDAKTKAGLFTVHQIKDKYFYEIPKGMLNKELLWVSQVSKTTLGAGNGGDPLGSRVVRWERVDNKINLRSVNYKVTADPATPTVNAVRNTNNDTIIMTFPIATFGKEEAPVIDVTRLFTTDVFELSAKQRLNATALDSSRTFIERISTFPENINVVATHTYTRAASPAGAAAPTSQFGQGGMNPGSASVVMFHSMVKLPENPMMPRLFDDRVGYFSISKTDFGTEEHRAVEKKFIVRWRLEKKDPTAAVSEPVKPIVYYIDSATPTKLIPYVKRGVEKWQKAFEAAGFKNAIIAKVAPTKEEDPEFNPEDARYSVIRWLASTTENAVGPNINDPRTGEILEADIQMYHNVMNLLRSWYFVQASPLDPRAQKLPLSDDLMGDLVEYVVAHEVGHTLGFQHNMKASSTYPQEKIRDAEWLKTMGHTPTLMDYSRFNYVVQPEDKIDPKLLIPMIGPYDVWATAWGYKPIPGAKTPEEERDTLDAMAKEQDDTPWLRFSTSDSNGSDPGELTEAVGDADAVKSTGLGLKNLERVSKYLLSATSTQKGDSYDTLIEVYGRLLGQWSLEMNHVVAVVGGVNTRQKSIGQEGLAFIPVPKSRQSEAVRFLNDNAFKSPTWAVDKEIIRRIEPVGAINRIRTAQSGVLSNLLSSTRFARLVEQQAFDGNSAYSPAEFLTDVRNGVFAELGAAKVTVDAYRRNLQRAYLDIANTKINPPATSGTPQPSFGPAPITSGDERAMYRAELRSLQTALRAAAFRSSDRITKSHIEGLLDQIGKILDPSENGAATPSRGFFDTQIIGAGDSCWIDYIIR